MLHFDTDYVEGAHQIVMKRLNEPNLELTAGYGSDDFKAKGYRLAIDSPTNQQFVVIPNDVMDHHREFATFEVRGSRGVTETTVRFVTSWTTTLESVDKFMALL